MQAKRQARRFYAVANRYISLRLNYRVVFLGRVCRQGSVTTQGGEEKATTVVVGLALRARQRVAVDATALLPHRQPMFVSMDVFFGRLIKVQKGKTRQDRKIVLQQPAFCPCDRQGKGREGEYAKGVVNGNKKKDTKDRLILALLLLLLFLVSVGLGTAVDLARPSLLALLLLLVLVGSV
jgi:hypothetical protein